MDATQAESYARATRTTCGHTAHFQRRTALKYLGLSGLAWLTPLGELLGRAAEVSPHKAKSLILLWLDGGPSQLETFDPHPNAKIAQGTGAIATQLRGVEIAAGMEQTADVLQHLSLVRNVVTKEGDHERATYNVKTGYRPDPTLTHPSIGAILAHQLPTGETSIPRHVSILPGAWPGRGGYLGDRFNAFLTGDPNQPIPDVVQRHPDNRFRQRLDHVSIVDQEFARGRLLRLEEERTRHRATLDEAVTMMRSDQLRAFDVGSLPQAERLQFGDSAFGRGCLAAARLVATGVRCVEVTLGGWDLAHASNHPVHERLTKVLDPALAGLVRYLVERDQWRDTIVMCCGEFGRTPQFNPAGGRDHWPHGFTVALGGGGLPEGRVIGETDPLGGPVAWDQGIPIADVHATVLSQLGVEHALELDTPANRPMKLCEGNVIDQLMS